MPSTTRIAVVEDEADLREVVVEYLRAQGLDALPCPDGAALDRALTDAPVDLVLLDINLPRESGLAIAKRLKRLPTPPGIIMVTALGEPVDRIVGLELGADDYIGKPFELRELLARVRSLVRRREAQAARPAAIQAGTARPFLPVTASAAQPTRFGPFTLRAEERKLLNQAGEEVPLTVMEFDLLLLLAARPRQVLSREALLQLAHGKEIEPFDRSIDVRITRLRRKLEADPANPTLIRTVRGQGYMFAPDDAG